MSAQYTESLFHSHRALVLQSGQYEATILPELGGNLISLRHLGKGYRFIRTPTAEEMAYFIRRPARFGVPVLFPPNRIDRGKFRFGGRDYQFPMNEPELDNHIHGLFIQRPWEVKTCGQCEGQAYAILSQQVDEGHPTYAIFPHRYELSIRYEVDASGLRQEVTAVNRGEEAMPLMLGFHSGFFAPFCSRSTIDDYSVKVTIGRRWQTGERMLPTGELEPLAEVDMQMKRDGVSPTARLWSDYYTAEPENGRNFMQLTDRREQAKFIYEVGHAYRNWVIWNDDGRGGFICVEPQTCTVNEINLQVPPEHQGLVTLEPHQTWSAVSRMYVECE